MSKHLRSGCNEQPDSGMSCRPGPVIPFEAPAPADEY